MALGPKVCSVAAALRKMVNSLSVTSLTQVSIPISGRDVASSVDKISTRSASASIE